MCGIAGYVSMESFRDGAICEALHHRGPDGSGQYKTHIDDKQVFLGHTRLKIIDLSEYGKQPMSAGDEKVHITYNGEIYNFKELKRRHLSHVVFKSQTDTEVILQLYLKMGWTFLPLLNGAFSFALLDENVGELSVVRDRMGIKPLYYFNQNDTFVFASEIRAMQQAGLDLKMDETQIAPYFFFKYVPGNDTLFQNIKRVPPGQRLTYNIKNKSLIAFNYWELPEGNFSDLNYAVAQEELYDLLGKAVRRRLMSDVPVATFLSGGLDSSIIAYFLKDEKQIRHYCARKSQNDLASEGSTSDYYHAKLLADKWNLDLHAIDIGAHTFSDSILKTIAPFNDDLIADGSMIPSYLIAKEASKNSTVVLSGMGADELFHGYAGHMLVKLSLMIEKLPGFLEKALCHWWSEIAPGKGKFKAYKRYLQKIGKYQFHPKKWMALNMVGDYGASLNITNQSKDNILDVFARYFENDQNLWQQIFHFEKDNFLVKNLHYVDRMSMANGMESRVPFLDHEVVEWAYQLPPAYKMNDFFLSKKILKNTFEKHLPKEIINRRKAGFGMPLRALIKQNNEVSAILSTFPKQWSFLNQDCLKIIRVEEQKGKADHSALLFALIAFHYWGNTFSESAVLTEEPVNALA